MDFFKKFILYTVAILSISNMVGCEKTFEFPKESDFSLSSTASAIQLTPGDKVTIKSTLENLTENNYNLNAAAVINKPNFIHVNVYGIDEDEIVYIADNINVDLKGKQKISEDNEFTMSKPGKYKAISSVIFEISEPKTNEVRKYTIESDKIYIDVK